MRNKNIWWVLLLTVVMGLGVPAAFGWMSQEWNSPFLVVGFVGLPFLAWPGYELWLTLWACKDICHRWFLPVLFPILLMATCGLWSGGLWPVAVAIFSVMLVFSVIIMFVIPKKGENDNEK